MIGETFWGQILACATCVGDPWSKADLGFFWSALVLMAVPVVAAGGIAGWLYFAYRRAAHQAQGNLVVREKESVS